MNRRRRSRRAFLVSFTLTLVTLSAIGVVFIIVSSGSPSSPNTPIPADLPAYAAAWADYAPTGILQVSFFNFTSIRNLNASALPAGDILQLVDQRAVIAQGSVAALATVTYATPNQTMDAAFLYRDAYSSFAAALGLANATEPTLLFTQALQGGQPVPGWLALVPSDSVVEFAQGGSQARQVIETSLQVRNGTAASIIALDRVKQALFVVNGTSGHLAMGLQTFPGAVRTGTMTAIAVDYVAGAVRISYAVGFNDTSAARASVSYMKSAYLNAQVISEYDSYLKAVQYDHFGQMAADTRLVG